MSLGGAPLLWVVGAGGLLGSAVSRLARAHYDVFDAGPIAWSERDGLVQIEAAAKRFVGTSGSSRPWAVAWCAGAGVIGTSAPELSWETDIIHGLLGALGGDPSNGVVFLSSSAGGVHGGCQALPITERSPIAPLSDYGSNKVVQEQAFISWVRSIGARGVIGRISNLYGPGQSLVKSQGLISKVCLAALLRQPIPVYVSLDTIRDFLFVDDCARLVLRSLERASSMPPGMCQTKIMASSQQTSIASVLAETRRVVGRRPTILTAPSPRAAQQAIVLSFRSEHWPDLDRAGTTPLATGIDRTVRELRLMLGAGALKSFAHV